MRIREQNDGVSALEFGRFAMRLKRGLAERTERFCRQHPEAAVEIREIMAKALGDIDAIEIDGDLTVGEMSGAAALQEAERN
ncbi:MAG: hypothetical protein NTW96_25925 [Planctomycetia bacterium]|nr:hypothetical protein [Planctomycetia bacterium]